ncbi:(+)-abscisic acid 8'-hydroxylase [Gloeocapsa sp. PCC 7428]|uniref:cytochrome P450 n=1 Tax=Gloeocapsa sp. PCC 7428 TaxID=1173026 RepID=UPI0002A5D8BA|nr:cytochrome P450 [Gloeocapsa sp. PCC 7428]AFZ32049.1 (+)-abscisic acid 8'-hydroxylase [Gloeocapsa sp. PCC 7428]
MTITDKMRSLPVPPGNFGLPVIGETLSFLRDPNFIQRRQQQHGNIYKTHVFGRPTVVMIGAEANRFLFSNENRYFSDGVSASAPRHVKLLMGTGAIVMQTGDKHLQQRKLLAQAFQPRSLAGYINTMAATTCNYLDKWEHTGNLNWYDELRKYTLDVACKLLIGIEANNDFGKLYENWGQGLLSIPLPLPGTKFSKALRCRKLLLAKIEAIILERQQQSTTKQDVLGLLLQARDEEGHGLSLQELKEQLLTLLFAGHDTLSSSLTALCLLLAQYPQVKEAIFAEQKQLGLEQPLTLDLLKQMTYLEQALKEVLRLYSPASGPRKAIESCEFNGYLIPEGWQVFYHPAATHQDSSIFTQPERFDPERFAPPRAEDKQKSMSYIPFGGGVRECIGREFAKLEMKLFAALLVRNYNWELVPGQNLNMVMLPTPHPRDGLKVKFWRRG